MTWRDVGRPSNERLLADMMRWPWTIRVDLDEEEGYLVASCVEIPSAFGVGETETDVERDFWESLRESLRVSLEFGDPIPFPNRQYTQESITASTGGAVVFRQWVI